jgi:hypothetical protein
MDVPFSCQLRLVPSAAVPPTAPGGLPWPERSCAIACVTMVLNYFGRRVQMPQILDAALARGALDPVRGWVHTRLVEVLQAHGLTAYRRNWRLLDGREREYLAGREPSAATRAELDAVRRQMLAEGRWAVTTLLDAQVPVIVSTHRPAGDRSSVGHQTVLVARDGRDLVFHDPALEAGAFLRMPEDVFWPNWKGTAIVAHDGQPWFDSGLSPSTG